LFARQCVEILALRLRVECVRFIAAEAVVEVLVAAGAFGRAACGGAAPVELCAASAWDRFNF